VAILTLEVMSTGCGWRFNGPELVHADDHRGATRLGFDGAVGDRVQLDDAAFLALRLEVGTRP